jgi:hypothetical protein
MDGTQPCAGATILSREGFTLGSMITGMIAFCKRLPLPVVVFLVLLFAQTCPLTAADSLKWRKDQSRVDADIKSWTLIQLLERVALSTGWEVYLDPGASHTVSVRFNDLPSGEALHALLGDLNFVVIPRTSGPSQLYVFRSSQDQATRLIKAPALKAGQPIPNQLVVKLKPGSRTKIDDLARALGARVIGRMDAQNTYLLEFDDEAATESAREKLLDNPDVESVDSNYTVLRPPAPSLSQSAAADLQLQPRSNDSNCQLVIGLIDTPVQSLGSNLNAFVKPSISVAGDSSVPPNQLTHGTAMAETILRALQAKSGGSTSVRIQPVDIYGNSEATSTFNVAAGIVQAVNNGANIINLSLGSSGNSQLLHNTITEVSKQGIPIYAAAGNEPVTTPTYPAAFPEVIAVTASDRSGEIASYANRGSFVKVIAPGDNVVSFNGQNYLVQGTSTSTALASGMAAGLADSAHACADQAQALLQKALAPAK